MDAQETIRQFEKQMKGWGYSHRTIESYTGNLGRFGQYLSSRHIHDLRMVDHQMIVDYQIKVMSDQIKERFGTVIPAVKSPSVYISIEIPGSRVRRFICFEREQYPEIGWSWSMWRCRDDENGFRVQKEMIKTVPRAKVILGLFIARADNQILDALKELKFTSPELHKEVSNKFFGTVLP